MTNSKAYNTRIYCKLKDIELESDEAKEFLTKTILEQLTTIKFIRDSNNEKELEISIQEDYSILTRIIKK